MGAGPAAMPSTMSTMPRPDSDGDSSHTRPPTPRPRPRRVATYTLTAMLWFAIFALYAMRTNLSIAIHSQRGMGQFDWGDKEKGVLLSSFFWGYITSQLPGGWLATKFGGRRVLLTSMVCSIIATIATPAAAAFSLNAAIACRVLLGVASGVLFPVLASMLGRWVTDVDRATCYNIADTGGSCGVILCALGGPWLIENGSVEDWMGWQFCFYYPAALGALWVVLWVVLVSDSPATSTWISVEERAWILSALEHETTSGAAAAAAVKKKKVSPEVRTTGSKSAEEYAVPWSEMLRAPSLWGMYCGNVAANWTWYTLLTFLPQYLLEIMGFDLTKSGILFTVPYLCMMCSELLGAHVADWLISTGRASRFATRTGATILAGLGCAACLIGVAQQEDTTGTIVLFGASLAFLALNNSGSFLVGNDLYPMYAGVAMGVANTLGTIPGILSPILSGVLLENGKCPKNETYSSDTPSSCAEAWDSIFYIAAAVYTVFALSFYYFASTSYKGVGYRVPRPESGVVREKQPLLGRMHTNTGGSDMDSVI